jgi:hypothetical protein
MPSPDGELFPSTTPRRTVTLSDSYTLTLSSVQLALLFSHEKSSRIELLHLSNWTHLHKSAVQQKGILCERAVWTCQTAPTCADECGVHVTEENNARTICACLARDGSGSGALQVAIVRGVKTDMTDVGEGTMVGGVGGDGDGDIGDWRASLRAIEPMRSRHGERHELKQ